MKKIVLRILMETTILAFMAFMVIDSSVLVGVIVLSALMRALIAVPRIIEECRVAKKTYHEISIKYSELNKDETSKFEKEELKQEIQSLFQFIEDYGVIGYLNHEEKRYIQEIINNLNEK